MKLLKERPSIIFIVFILLLFIVFTSAIVIFHTSVSETVQKEQQVSSDLTATKEKLERTTELLLNREKELNKSQNDIETFDSLYTETNTELEKTSSSLDATQKALKASEAVVQTQKAQIVDLNTKNNQLTSQIQTDAITIEELEEDLAKVEKDLKNICDDYPEHNECD